MKMLGDTPGRCPGLVTHGAFSAERLRHVVGSGMPFKYLFDLEERKEPHPHSLKFHLPRR
jgi:hypothetical protein